MLALHSFSWLGFFLYFTPNLWAHSLWRWAWAREFSLSQLKIEKKWLFNCHDSGNERIFGHQLKRRNTHLRSNCLNHFASNNCHIEPNLFPWIHPVSMLSIYILLPTSHSMSKYSHAQHKHRIIFLSEHAHGLRDQSDFGVFRFVNWWCSFRRTHFSVSVPLNRNERTRVECRVWFFVIVHTLSRGRYIQVIGYCVNRNVFYIQ